MKQKKGIHQEKWMSIVEIYWHAWWLDTGMHSERIQLLNRKSGRPKINKQFRKLGFPPLPKAELSRAYVFEFYLQCMQYHSGTKDILKWCREHLRTKELEECWQHPLHNNQDRKYFEPILNDSIFISMEEDIRRGILWVKGKQVFENPFKFILKHVWMWNSAIDYCLKQFEDLGIRGEKAIAFRAFLSRELTSTHAPIDYETFDRYLRRAKDYIHVKPKPD